MKIGVALIRYESLRYKINISCFIPEESLKFTNITTVKNKMIGGANLGTVMRRPARETIDLHCSCSPDRRLNPGTIPSDFTREFRDSLYIKI